MNAVQTYIYESTIVFFDVDNYHIRNSVPIVRLGIILLPAILWFEGVDNYDATLQFVRLTTILLRY